MERIGSCYRDENVLDCVHTISVQEMALSERDFSVESECDIQHVATAPFVYTSATTFNDPDPFMCWPV